MCAIAAVSLILCCSAVANAGELARVAGGRRVESPGSFEMSFTQGDLRQEQVVLLGADARIDWPMLAGNNPPCLSA